MSEPIIGDKDMWGPGAPHCDSSFLSKLAKPSESENEFASRSRYAGQNTQYNTTPRLQLQQPQAQKLVGKLDLCNSHVLDFWGAYKS